MFLYNLPSSNFQSLFGTPENPTPKDDIYIIAQKPDCSSFLVLSNTAYQELTPFSGYEGYDFTYCQEWGLTINDEVVHRVWADIRAKAYPSIADQLDIIFHDGIDTWKTIIQSVKDKYPKL